MLDNNTSREISVSYVWQFRVRSDAHLDSWIIDYCDVQTMNHEKDGSSTLSGELPDMPAVYGLILKLRDAGIGLISLKVERMKL